VTTTLEQVIDLAKGHRVVPVIQELFSGAESPVAIFQKVAGRRPGSFLLESAEHGVWSRYSFIGVNSRGTISKNSEGIVEWKSPDGHSALPSGIEASLPNGALDALQLLCAAWTSKQITGLPPLTSGLVGTLAWDIIREIEDLPDAPPASYASPQMAFAMMQDVIVVDHQSSKLLLVSNIFVDDDARISKDYRLAVERIGKMREALNTPTETFLATISDSTGENISPNMTENLFNEMVNQAKHFVKIGDVFQVVLSQRFDVATEASALDIYRVLRALNPSPYMYLFNMEDEAGSYAVVGSSPEALVKVNNGHAVMHPIAGSRPRGGDSEQDQLLEASLLADAKERAEHLMLVDLARNDLLKVCEPTSVAVTEFMQVHKFSHIQHLVSTVEGDVRADQSVVDVFRATFPAGTLSGAPKPRALEIIDSLESENRGLFGGVVGYFDFAGNADLAIAIRTIFLRNQVAHVQAGAGIVLDSDPKMEYEETKSKASAPLKAIQLASNLRRVP
jgi:anthranilate synthase component 1